jgi:hypothetical protein
VTTRNYASRPARTVRSVDGVNGPPKIVSAAGRRDDDTPDRGERTSRLKLCPTRSPPARPAIGARMAYASLLPNHETGAYSLRRLPRRPTAAGKSSDFTFFFASTAADATYLFGNQGWHLLYEALFMVDDFGLTTRSGLLTRHRYWRKLQPGNRSSDNCPCKCGRWSGAKHQWGQPAPEIRVPRDWL